MTFIESTPASTDTDQRVRMVYDDLRHILDAGDLSPSADANLKDALASVSIAVASLGIAYEYLIDEGI